MKKELKSHLAFDGSLSNSLAESEKCIVGVIRRVKSTYHLHEFHRGHRVEKVQPAKVLFPLAHFTRNVLEEEGGGVGDEQTLTKTLRKMRIFENAK